MTEDQPMTPQEVADTLRIAKNTVYELVKRGELRAYKVGNKFRFNTKDVETYKNGGTTPAGNPPSGQGFRGGAVPAAGLGAAELDVPLAELPAGAPVGAAASGFILCGQDILLDILAQRMEAHPQGGRVYRSYLGSYNGLYALYQGQVHAATAHLWDGQTDSYNLPFLPHVLPGMNLMVVHLACRTVGFYVQKGNPRGLSGWTDLARGELFMVNRERGSGMRVLLDARLSLGGIAPSQVAGYNRVCTTHLAAAATVARGGGDFALGSEKAARQVNGIDFIPLQQERYELVFQKEDLARPLFRAMVEVVQAPAFRQELDGLGGYDTRETGRVIVG